MTFDEYKKNVSELMYHKEFGLDAEVTQKLRDMLQYHVDHRDEMTSAEQYESARFLGDSMARADFNQRPKYWNSLARSCDVGRGEMLIQSARCYVEELQDAENLPGVLQHMDEVCAVVGIKEDQIDSYLEELQRKEWEASGLAAVQEEMMSTDKEADYKQVLREENIPEDTPFDELPLFVAKKLESFGITDDEFLHKNEDFLQNGATSDTMEAGFQEETSRRDGIPGFEHVCEEPGSFEDDGFGM